MATITYDSNLTIFAGSTSTTDTLLFNTTAADLSSATVTSIEILKAGLTLATTFTVDQADLAAKGSVVGSTAAGQSDTLLVKDSAIDLTATTLTSVEILKAGSTDTTTFKVDQLDLRSGGSVVGTSNTDDALVINGPTLDLSSTTLSGIEILQAGKSVATSFTVDAADLATGGSVVGSAGKDMLVVKDVTIDLTSTTLTSIEVLKAGKSGPTTFSLDQADFAPGGSVIGSSGSDTLTVGDTDFDLSSTTLTSIERLMAGSTDATTFTLNQLDLASKGSIVGVAGKNDALVTMDSRLDLTSTTLSDVEILKAGTTIATTFTVDATDLTNGGSVVGNAGDDTLVVKSSIIDLTSTTLSSIEALKVGVLAASTITVKSGDLAANGGELESIVGSTGADTLKIAGTAFDLSGTTLTSVEKLVATADDTRVTLDQADLAKGGSVIGSTSGGDEIRATGSSLDLSSSTVSGVEFLSTGNTVGTAFTVSAAQFSGGSAIGEFDGSAGADSLAVKSSAIDTTSTTLTSIETLKAGLASATTFTVDRSQLGGMGGLESVVGSTRVDTLIITGTDFDLSSTALTSVERLQAATTGSTSFMLDQDDLAKNGSIIGHTTATDSILAAGTSLDLSKTTLTAVDELVATSVADTTFTLTGAQVGVLDIFGNKGTDTLKVASTSVDVTTAALSSIEILAAGLSTATTFKVDQGQLAAKSGALIGISGGAGVDTLIVAGTDVDLSSTALSSIEKLTASANGTLSTTFSLDQSDLASGGTITGSTNAKDLIVANDTSLDLSSTTLSGVEMLTAGQSDTLFTLDAADLKVLTGGISGAGGTNTLALTGSAFDVSSATLSDIDVLRAAGTAATTFTVLQSQLGAAGSISEIQGTKLGDTLIVKGTDFDVSSVTLTSVERLKASSASATTFTVDQADLASGGTVQGSTGIDTLLTAGTGLDLSSTTLTSVEVIRGDNAGGTKFILNQADLAKGGSVVGDTTDEIVAADTQLDLTSTTLTSVEKLSAGTAGDTKFTVDQADLAAGGSLAGNTGTDTLVIKGTGFDLTSTDTTSVEILKAGSNLATTFKVDLADLAGNGSIVGSSGRDTLIVTGTDFDLSATALTSIETLKAGSSDGVTFTLTQDDLVAGGSVIGSSGIDTIAAAGSSLNLTSTALSSIEAVTISAASGAVLTVTASQLATLDVTGGTSAADVLVVAGTNFDLTSTTLSAFEGLKAGSSSATSFTLDAADIAALGTAGSITGSSGIDTLTVAGTTDFNLASTALTSVEVLKAGASTGVSFTLDGADLAVGGSIVGSSGTDTIVVNSTQIDLSSTTLTSIEALQAGSTSDTTFTLTQAQASSLAVSGSTGDDTLIIAGTSYDVTSTVLTSVENLQAGSSLDTTFTVDQADLAAGGSVSGSSGTDTLIVKGTGADLSGTTLVSVEVLKTTSGATTFTVNDADLVSGGGSLAAIVGSGGGDTLAAADTLLDLSGVTLTSVETLAAVNTDATTFSVDNEDLAAGGGSITLVGGVALKDDTLQANGTTLDLSGTTLTSVEIIAAGASAATTFVVDKADLIAGGSVLGETNGSDTLVSTGTDFDLSSTTLTSVETLKGGSTAATTFTVNQADLVTSGGSIIGSTSSGDAVAAADTSLDVTSTTLTGIEVLRAGTDNDTTLTVDQSHVDALGSGGSITGGAGLDTLVAAGTLLDLDQVSVTGIEALKAGSTSSTTFIVDQTDLVFGGSVTGSTSAADTLEAAGTSLNVANLTLSGIEIFATENTAGTLFTFAGGQQVGVAVEGSSGTDAIAVKSTDFDLTSTATTSIEMLKSGSTGATTFTVDAGDLASGGSVTGVTGADDTLVITGTVFDLSSTSLTSVEILQAGSTSATEFTVDQADLVSGGSIVGSTSAGDKLIASGTSLNLSGTTLTGIENIVTTDTSGTIITVADKAALAGITIDGNGSADTLVVKDTDFDVTATTLNDVEILQAGSSSATTFTVDQASLDAGGSVVGSSGDDTLLAVGTALDLSSTALTSVEILRAGTNSATTFTVNQADLTAGGSVMGSGGSDTLLTADTQLDLSSTAVSSIEILRAGTASSTTFTVDQGDLASAGTIAGSSGSDTVKSTGTALDLSSTTLSSIEIIQAGSSIATSFTVDQADLAAGGLVKGSTGIDTLAIAGTGLDLTATTLSSIEALKAGTTNATTFKVDQGDLASGGSVIGSSGTDTLQIGATTLDLSATTLASIEILQSTSTFITTFSVGQDDLAIGGSIDGSSGFIWLYGTGTGLDLTSTTLTKVELLSAQFQSTENTTFTVDQADLFVGGGIQGYFGTDTLKVHGTSLDLRSTVMASIEVITTDSSSGTTFTLDQFDILGIQAVVGDAGGTDTLSTGSTELNSTSIGLTSVEILKAGTSLATVFTVDQADLASGGTVQGSSGTDTLIGHGTALDLSSTTLDSIEVVKTDSAGGTTFTLDQGELASGGTLQGSSGTDTLVIAGTALDTTSSALSSIEVLKAGSTAATTFTVDAADLASGGSVIGSGDTSGSDVLIVKSNTIDLSSTTLTNIDVIETAVPTNGTTFTLGSGQGGATVALTANAKADSIAFSSAYHVTDVTDEASIMAHVVSIGSFEDGVGGDVLNVSAISNGAPAASVDITGFINLVNPSTLKQALDIAAVGDGGTTSTVVTFQFGGDTYVLVDKSSSTTLTSDDAVIKLVGTHALSDASNFVL